ncbi:MAG TPA: D-glycero-beta-D-manno-heptose-7-phosphate kinase [Saprospiraceae bacterium]|nr:D-glycero-beta-D-manno-heptose-7-phosphate kinase [Saprospiraceae bacterium]
MNDKKDLIARFGQKTILVVGDVMLDTYLLGTVERISPEAPVPVVLLEQTEYRLGGAANVALNVKSLGGSVLLCSVVGQDKNGELLKNVLAASQLTTKGIVSSTERKTTIKSRIFSSGQQLLRVDEEDHRFLSQDEEDIFLANTFGLLKEHDIDVILFQDYNKGVLTERVIKKLIAYAKKHQIKTVVDPKSLNFFAYEGVTLFKPNLKEIRDALGTEILAKKEALDEAVGDLMERLSCESVLVTLSEKGLYAKDFYESFLMPTTTKSVADVSGAGDTVISVIALGLACQAALYEVAELSNMAAGIVCSKLGVVPIQQEELAEAYD